MALKKLAVNVKPELIDKIDAYADKLNITRTAAVSVLISQALDFDASFEMLTELKKLSDKIEK